MKNYVYQGEQTMLTLRLEDGSEQEYFLRTGGTFSLPEEHQRVADMVEQKLLTPAPVATPTAPEKVDAKDEIAATPITITQPKKGGSNA